jgi:ATP-dependent Clp protease ATP-binding subunit ClpA
MFERFTELARQVVVLAQDEAHRSGAPSIGTEHLVLGLAAEDRGLAAHVLAQAGMQLEPLRAAVRRRLALPDAEALATIGIDLEAVRRAVERTFGPGALGGCKGTQVPFTPAAKKALELSLREAAALQHQFIGTEHILLGVEREGGTGLAVLRELGLGDVRRLVLDALEAA